MKMTYRMQVGNHKEIEISLTADRGELEDAVAFFSTLVGSLEKDLTTAPPAADDTPSHKASFKFQLGDKVRHCNWHGVWEVRQCSNAYSLARLGEADATGFVSEEAITLATEREINEYNRLNYDSK